MKWGKKKKDIVLKAERKRKREKEKESVTSVVVLLFHLFGFRVSCLELQMVQWIWCSYKV